MVSFQFVPYEEIQTKWPYCKDILEKSFRDLVNVHSLDDYYHGLLDQLCQLWLALDNGEVIGAVITQVDEGSAMRVCSVLSIAGERFSEWAHLFDQTITDFAKQHHCHAIEAVTRRGFARVLPDLREDGVIYVKLLEACK